MASKRDIHTEDTNVLLSTTVETFSKWKFFQGKRILPFHRGYQGEFRSVEKSPKVLQLLRWQLFPQWNGWKWRFWIRI
jgi:hypothetical protein